MATLSMFEKLAEDRASRIASYNTNNKFSGRRGLLTIGILFLTLALMVPVFVLFPLDTWSNDPNALWYVVAIVIGATLVAMWPFVVVTKRIDAASEAYWAEQFKAEWDRLKAAYDKEIDNA